MMKALASPVRLAIVDILTAGERCLCELQPRFRMNKSTLSRHVAALRNAGLVVERAVGPRRMLSLRGPVAARVLRCLERAANGRRPAPRTEKRRHER